MLRLSPLLLLLLGVACQAPSELEPPDDTGPAEADCDSSLDADGDGLDECRELELGTDPDVADSDGDGLSDGDEADCVSDPLDANELCYACGWAHGDPGDLESTGSSVGDVIDNIQFIDQCGEDLPLWDLAGAWHVLFMTAEWCEPCIEEARLFPQERADFVARTGLEFSFITTLFQDDRGGLPDAKTAADFAGVTKMDDQPVVADLSEQVLNRTPYDGRLLPGVCALTPEMVILDCVEGEHVYLDMLALIEQTAAR